MRSPSDKTRGAAAGRIVEGASTFRLPTRYRLEIPRGRAPRRGRGLVVTLHGMGQSADVFHPVVAPLAERRILLVPDAPLPFETTTRDGDRVEGHGWYIYTGDQDAFIESAARAQKYVERLMRDVVRDHAVDVTDVTLLGYSQGGYLAGMMALQAPTKWRNVVTIASRIKSELWMTKTAKNPVVDAPGRPRRRTRRLPRILAVHGKKDRFIPIDRARECAADLEACGFDVTFREYPSGHRPTEEQIHDVGGWLDAD